MLQPETRGLPITKSFTPSEAAYWRISRSAGVSQDYRNDCKLVLFGQVMINLSPYLDPEAFKGFSTSPDFDPLAQATSSVMLLLDSLKKVKSYSDFVQEKVDLAKSKGEASWHRFEVEHFICPSTKAAAECLDELAALVPVQRGANQGP